LRFEVERTLILKKTSMKRKRLLIKQFAVGSLALLLTSFVFTGCSKDDDNNNTNNANYTISGNANGSQMVPSVSGNGTGAITGTYNPSTHVLSYNVGWNGLSGNATSGGFYAGNSGVAGTAVSGTNFTITPGSSNTQGSIMLTSAQENAFLNNGWYYSVGTAANPTGEIRGQITATR
jgi:hypothetical protein